MSNREKDFNDMVELAWRLDKLEDPLSDKYTGRIENDLRDEFVSIVSKYDFSENHLGKWGPDGNKTVQWCCVVDVIDVKR